MNATFGNAVELILGMIALKEGLIRVVQGKKKKNEKRRSGINSMTYCSLASILGSILSNILLVSIENEKEKKKGMLKQSS